MKEIGWAFLVVAVWVGGGLPLAAIFWRWGPDWLTGKTRIGQQRVCLVVPARARRRFFRMVVLLWPFAFIWMTLRCIGILSTHAATAFERRLEIEIQRIYTSR